MDSKLPHDGLGFQLNWESKTFWTLTFELLGQNIQPRHFKTKRVAETALRASWFWDTSARFPANRGISSSPADSKLTPDGLGFQWNGHRNTFWTCTFEVAGRNIALLLFKTERVGGSALRVLWFWGFSARSGETWEIFSSPKVSKLTPDCLRCDWNADKTFWTFTFELLGLNLSPLYLKTERVAEIPLGASWFWLTSGGFPVTWGIFPVPWTLN